MQQNKCYFLNFTQKRNSPNSHLKLTYGITTNFIIPHTSSRNVRVAKNNQSIWARHSLTCKNWSSNISREVVPWSTWVLLNHTELHCKLSTTIEILQYIVEFCRMKLLNCICVLCTRFETRWTWILLRTYGKWQHCSF